MNAEAARKLSLEHLKGPVMAPFLAHVHANIAEQCKAGRSSLSHPFSGLKGMTYPSHEVKEMVFNALRQEGYEVKHHPDPDPGAPGSCEYDEIKW